MAVRKTESRIPANFQASDLGQSIVTADGRCALVSFTTSPIIVSRENIYVLFVTDAALAAAAQSFEWTFKENGDIIKIQTTERSEIACQPQTTETLNAASADGVPRWSPQLALKLDPTRERPLNFLYLTGRAEQ